MKPLDTMTGTYVIKNSSGVTRATTEYSSNKLISVDCTMQSGSPKNFITRFHANGKLESSSIYNSSGNSYSDSTYFDTGKPKWLVLNLPNGGRQSIDYIPESNIYFAKGTNTPYTYDANVLSLSSNIILKDYANISINNKFNATMNFDEVTQMLKGEFVLFNNEVINSANYYRLMDLKFQNTSVYESKIYLNKSYTKTF